MATQLVVEVQGGCVTTVKDLRTQKDVVYILRDHDNIKSGDLDPIFECPRCHKWYQTEHEGGSDTPLCDTCWASYPDDERAEYWRGYWAGRSNWGKDGNGQAYNNGFRVGQAYANRRGA